MPQASGVSADISTAAPQSSTRQVRIQNSGSDPAEHPFSRMLADSHGQTERPERTARAEHTSQTNRSSQSRRIDAPEHDASAATESAGTEQTVSQDKSSSVTARDDASAPDHRDAARSSAAASSDADEANVASQQEQDQAADMLQRLQASRQMADSLQQQQTATATVSSDITNGTGDGADGSEPADDTGSDTDLAAASPDGSADPAMLLATPLPVQATIAAVPETVTATDTDGPVTGEPGRSGVPMAKQAHLNDAAGTQPVTDANADLTAQAAPQAQTDVTPSDSATDSAGTSAISAALSEILDKKSAPDGIDPLHARLQQMAEGIAKGQSARHLVLDDASAVPMSQTAVASAMQSAMQQKNTASGEGHDSIGPAGANTLQGMDQIQSAHTDAPTASELALAGQNVDKLTPAQDDAQKITTKTPVLPSLYLQNAQPDEQALGARILMMAGQKWHEAELELEPQGLGKLKIQLTMDAEQQTNVQFIAQQAHVKEMLEQSLPKFREWLNQNGFQAGQTQVQTQSDWSGQQSQTFGQNGSDDSRNNTPTGYQNGTLSDTENAPTAILAKVRGNQGVDFYA